MRGIRCLLGVVLVCASASVSAESSNQCYVMGGTSDSDSKRPSGSRQNPYGSLAEVQADPDCRVINVLYSETPLDGGIVLKNGQHLIGRKGKSGALPVITNSSIDANEGFGVVLAKDNRVSKLHVADTWRSGVVGDFNAQPTGGKIRISDLRITGANQSGDLSYPLGDPTAFASFTILSIDDTDITILRSDIGEAAAASIGIIQYAGSATVMVRDSSIRDQGHNPGAGTSAGIVVIPVGSASADVSIISTSVSNIGEGNSNSDGLLLLNFGAGEMNVLVDDYQFSNPDGGGGGSATGIELGMLFSPGGGAFHGRVVNSVIEDSNSVGIQVVDQVSEGGNNTVTAEIHNNIIRRCLFGINSGILEAPHSNLSLDIKDNHIVDSTLEGIYIFSGFGVVANHDIKIEGNSLVNSGVAGLYFGLFNGAVLSSNYDAGLGGLGSAGLNRIVGSGVADITVVGDIDVSAANNWWGSDAGPTSVEELNGGTVDVDPFLESDPQ